MSRAGERADGRPFHAWAGVMWLLVGAAFGYLSLVQLGFTGEYAVADLGSASLNAVAALLGLAIGARLIRRSSSSTLSISVVFGAAVVVAGGLQLIQDVGGMPLALAVVVAGLAGATSALALGRVATVSAPSGASPSDRMQVSRLRWRRATLAVTRTRLEYVFLVIAIAWGVLQVFIVPPLQVPDEGDHWFRAWALTDGQLTADREGMVTVPGAFTRMAALYTQVISVGPERLPPSLEGQPGFFGYEDLFNGAAPSGAVRIASRVARYGPVGYLPQAVGIGLGRLVGAPPLTCFYLARLGNLFAALALLFFAIRLAPFGKHLYLLLALLPMTMFELASVSCDALTISGGMFFTALLLWASARVTLRRSDVALVLLATTVLLNVKPGYWALVLLVLLIRPAQVGGRARYLAFVAANAFLVVVVFLILFLLTSTDAQMQAVASPSAQLSFIFTQPLSFLGILWSNLQNNLLEWTFESIGRLGWLTIALPQSFYLFVLAVGLVYFIWVGEEVVPRLWQRTLLAVVGVAVFLTIAVALYASLEPTGSGRVFFQGRYLAPVWLLLLLSGYGIPSTRRYRGVPLLVSVSLMMMVQTLQTLTSYYQS